MRLVVPSSAEACSGWKETTTGAGWMAGWLDFGGKHALQARTVARQSVSHSLNQSINQGSLGPGIASCIRSAARKQDFLVLVPNRPLGIAPP
jgi:hypothetical protein